MAILKSKGSKVLAAIAAAGTMLMGGIPPTAASSSTTSIQQQSSSTNSQQQAPPVQQVNTIKNISHGMGSMAYIINNGIPPKVYGTYYVKRGTHKRTNKL